MRTKHILSLITAFLFCFLTCLPAFSYAAGSGDIVTESYDDGGLVFTPAKTGDLSKDDINTNGAASVFTTIRNTSEAKIYTISCKMMNSEDETAGLKAAIYASGEENSECVSISEDALNKSTKIAELAPGEILYVITLVETEDGFNLLKNDISFEFTYVGVTDKSLADETDGTETSTVSVEANKTETDTETETGGISAGVKIAIAVTGSLVMLFDTVVVASLIRKRKIKKKEDE